MAMGEKTYELLDTLADQNPRPAEKWFSEDFCDPRFARTTLLVAQMAGRIEINMDGDVWQFRFTSKGRNDYERAISTKPNE